MPTTLMNPLEEYLQAQSRRYEQTPDRDEESSEEQAAWEALLTEVRAKVAAMHPPEKEAYFEVLTEWDEELSRCRHQAS